MSSSTIPVDPFKELNICLESITKNAPPESHKKFGGLYSGPTSIALLFFKLSQLYPGLTIQDETLLTWSKRYLAVPCPSQLRAPPTTDDCGVHNQYLVALAVRALIYGDAVAAKELCTQPQLLEPGGSDEWLYGRAGYLYLLRLARTGFPPGSLSSEETIQLIDQTTKRVIKCILGKTDEWTWHGKQYYGSAHGTIGIITQVVLSSPKYLPAVESKLTRLLEQQLPNGNFESSYGSQSGGRLVQFCHGAPGFVLSLESIRTVSGVSTELIKFIDAALVKARQITWAQGALKKEPCLCHGIAGNALALDDRDQFNRFLAMMTEEQNLKLGYTPSDSPYSLYCGLAGRAWVWAVADKKLPKVCLGYNDL